MAEKVVKEETDSRKALLPQEIILQSRPSKLEQEESKEAAPEEEDDEGADLEMLEMFQEDDDEVNLLM